MPRVSNEYGVLTCFRSKMQTKIILRPLPIIIFTAACTQTASLALGRIQKWLG